MAQHRFAFVQFGCPAFQFRRTDTPEALSPLRPCPASLCGQEFHAAGGIQQADRHRHVAEDLRNSSSKSLRAFGSNFLFERGAARPFSRHWPDHRAHFQGYLGIEETCARVRHRQCLLAPKLDGRAAHPARSAFARYFQLTDLVGPAHQRCRNTAVPAGTSLLRPSITCGCACPP